MRLNTTNNAQLWLNSTSKSLLVSQLCIFVVRLMQLAMQIGAFWFFAEMMFEIIVKQKSIGFNNDAGFASNSLFMFLLLSVGWLVTMHLASFLSHYAKGNIEKNIEAQLHTAFKLEQTAIVRQHSSTFWQQLMLDNLSDVGDYFTQYTIQKWLAGCTPFIVLLVVFPVNYIVGITLLITLPIVPLFMVLVGKGAANLHRKHFIALERLGDMFSDRLKGLLFITAAHQHTAQTDRLENASNILNRKTMNVVSVAFLSSSVLDFFSTVSIALIAVFIGFTLIGEFQFGPEINLHLGLFMLLVSPLLFAELRTLGRFYHQKAKAEASAERFYEVLSHQLTVKNHADFIGVSWLNYTVTVPELHAEKLSINPKDWVLLTGDSGAGKTALLEALMGFRHSSHSLNTHCTLLNQQAVIVDNTVSYNLTLGHKHINDEEIYEALNNVQLMGWAQTLPNGLSSLMGDCPTLSGGEAQRLALARVLLLNKGIVFLDEPTAHLTEAQHELMSELIHKYLSEKTVIWASHKHLPAQWFSARWHVANKSIRSLV